MNLDFILAFVVGLSLFGVIVGFWWFKKTKAKVSVAEIIYEDVNDIWSYGFRKGFFLFLFYAAREK